MKTSLFCKLAVYPLFVSFLISCTAEEPKKSSSGSSKPPASGETPSSVAPLALKISTTYDGTDTAQDQTFTETGTTICEATASSPIVNCSISVPEGRLYYSETKLLISWETASCKLLEFEPYSYIASTSMTFKPFWSDSTIDCSVDPKPKDCYGGAAPQIVPEFPNNKGFIYLPEEGSTEDFLADSVTIPSGHSLKYASNRLTSNDLASSKQGANQSITGAGGRDGYIATSYKGYTYTCRDDWYDPVQYRINLSITDVDSDSGGTVNHYETWREIP